MTRFIKRRKDIKTSKSKTICNKVSQKESSQKENHIPDTKKKVLSPCIICHKPSVGAVSFDLDLPKFPYCKKHDFDVWLYCAMMVSGKPEDADSYITFVKKHNGNRKANTKKATKKGKRNC